MRSELDGRVWCWGENLGNGTTNKSSTPVLVAGLQDVTDVATSGAHTCALRADQSMVCWGRGSSGELGNGSLLTSLVPTPVSNMSDAAAIYMGPWGCNCAIRGDGTAWCWGRNADGELGDGTQTARAVPTRVADFDDVTALAMGASHTCALRASDTIECWTTNAASSVTGRPTPPSLPSPCGTSRRRSTSVRCTGHAVRPESGELDTPARYHRKFRAAHHMHCEQYATERVR